MLYGLLWLCLLAGVPLLLVVKFAGAAFWSIIATEAVMVVLLVMVKRGRIRIPSIAIPSIILVLVGVAMYHGQGIRDVATVGLFVVVSFAGLLLGVRGLLTFTVLTILTFGLISYFEISGVLIVPAYPETSSKHVVIFAATIALFAVLQRLTLQYLFDNLRAAEISERTLSQRNAELELPAPSSPNLTSALSHASRNEPPSCKPRSTKASSGFISAATSTRRSRTARSSALSPAT